MSAGPLLTPEEIALIEDPGFFRAKAVVMGKVRLWLEAVHAAIREELAGVDLLAPRGFDKEKCQFVKGEHLDEFPYQYLDYPKHFDGDDKFTMRSLFWWGHHFVFALILEGEHLARYKQNLLARFAQIADRQIAICLGPLLWEWKRGDGITLPLSRDRRADLAAVLDGRRTVKLARFVEPGDPLVRNGTMTDVARATLRAFLPVITP